MLERRQNYGRFGAMSPLTARIAVSELDGAVTNSGTGTFTCFSIYGGT